MSSVTNEESNKRLVDKIGQFITLPFSFIRESKELSLHARWLFVTLRFYTNGKSGVAFPSYETIKELTGMRRQKIADSIRELEGKGWLTKRKRFGKSNLYTLNIPPKSANRQRSEIVEASRRGHIVVPHTPPNYGTPRPELEVREM